MIEFQGEYELIQHLKKQDLTKYGVSMSATGKTLKDGWLAGPYHITGYLYVKETMEFPVGERFRVSVGWSEQSECKRSINRVREAIKEEAS